MWWILTLATVVPIADHPGDLSVKSVYRHILEIDETYRLAGRDPAMRRNAERKMDALINRLQRIPGIHDPYADQPLRPCLRAAVLTRQSRRLEWERIISRIPDDHLIAAGLAPTEQFRQFRRSGARANGTAERELADRTDESPIRVAAGSLPQALPPPGAGRRRAGSVR